MRSGSTRRTWRRRSVCRGAEYDKFEMRNSSANLAAIAGHLDTERSVFQGDQFADRLRVLRTVGETVEALIAATRVVAAPDSPAGHVPGYMRGQAENLASGRPARIASAIPLILQERIGTPPPL